MHKRLHSPDRHRPARATAELLFEVGLTIRWSWPLYKYLPR
jgi:hypothetical protein